VAAQTCKYGSIPATAPASRFSDNDDGTVTDTSTGLQWKRCAEGQSWNGVTSTCEGGVALYTWQQALQIADNQSTDDWRLPNTKELASIVELACTEPAIDLIAFPGTPSKEGFWSSSPVANVPDKNGHAWFMAYTGGDGYGGKGTPYAVRLVRDEGGTPSPGTSPLNDTGITTCGDAETPPSNSLTCPVDQFPGQDAEFGRDVTHDNDTDGHAGFSFTKLDANGNPLGADALSWTCVRDNVTGRVWEVKTNDGALPLRDKDWTYTWYDPDPALNGGHAGTQDGGTCFGGISCDTYSYLQAVNDPARGLCGAHDWRLPTREELRSIVDYSRSKPAIDTNYFPDIESGWSYWSSSPFVNDSASAWNIPFDDGHDFLKEKAEGDHVRLVRGGSLGPTTPEEAIEDALGIVETLDYLPRSVERDLNRSLSVALWAVERDSTRLAYWYLRGLEWRIDRYYAGRRISEEDAARLISAIRTAIELL
jgi:hypothetical protein